MFALEAVTTSVCDHVRVDYGLADDSAADRLLVNGGLKIERMGAGGLPSAGTSL